ncbi:MAG: tetratricopeptide repeat protein [Pseudomonadota bacterium]
MKTWTSLFMTTLLAACASAPPAIAPPVAGLFDDSRFAPPREQIGTENLFGMTEDMRTYLRTELAAQSHLGGNYDIRKRLFDALYKKGELKIDYDTSLTRTAAQTFAARSGNCLSLAVMTAVFAREAGLDAHFQSVDVERSWSRTGGVYVGNGHVNVVLENPIGAKRWIGDQQSHLTVDFLPQGETSGHRTDDIDDERIAAMFMNNRAAEALTAGRLDDAYWWARRGVAEHPQFLPAWNTLGVIYQRHGDLFLAERVFGALLARDADSTLAMSNLIPVLKTLGKADEAAALDVRLRALEPHQAFQYFNQGLAAMRSGDFKAARTLFAKEVKRDPYYHEFHFWLAQAYYRLGENAKADEELAVAIQTSTTGKDKATYSAKLERLRALH